MCISNNDIDFCLYLFAQRERRSTSNVDTGYQSHTHCCRYTPQLAFRWVVNLLWANVILPSGPVRAAFHPGRHTVKKSGLYYPFPTVKKNIFRAVVKKIQHVTIVSYESLVARMQVWLLIFTLEVYGTLSVPNKFHGCVTHWKLAVYF